MIRGIDVSKYQEIIDWNAVKKSGIQFAWIRASKGREYVDPMFYLNWENAQKVGIIVGAYHYFTPTLDATGQAHYFTEVITKANGKCLPPALDIEDIDNLTSAKYITSVKVCLNIAENKIGRKPFVYTYTSFADEHSLGKFFGDYPLWIARYNSKVDAPNGWKKWTFWQFSNKGSVPGIKGAVDFDYFNGGINELKALVK